MRTFFADVTRPGDGSRITVEYSWQDDSYVQIDKAWVQPDGPDVELSDAERDELENQLTASFDPRRLSDD
jgi:hypothetical protein